MRYTTGLLILLILLVCGLLIKANSQLSVPPANFSIAVEVVCDNPVHKSLIEDAIKQELRNLGDVHIVTADFVDALWEYLIIVQLFPIDDDLGSVIRYATSRVYLKKVPIEHIDKNWQAFYRKYPALNMPTTYTGRCGIHKLDDFGKSVVNDFDEAYLQNIRDLHRITR